MTGDDINLYKQAVITADPHEKYTEHDIDIAIPPVCLFV